MPKIGNESGIDDLINGVFDSTALREKFYERISYLGITITEALEILDMASRTLAGILNGTQKLVNLISLKKLAIFLNIEEAEIMALFLEALENKNSEELELFKRKAFIDSNFDLTGLKKSGFIDNILDYDHIEKCIKEHFGFQSIFEYGKVKASATFSSINRKSKDAFNRFFWVESCHYEFDKINNPNAYDREILLKYIPKIRWYTTLEEQGLFQVIRVLFTLGVTVIYKPYLSSLLVRGATLSVNSKPCIALTDYTKYYPTVWFSLMHELYHVLFHFDMIQDMEAHVSSEKDMYSQEEVEADNFAREYLFSNEKMKVIKPSIGDEYAVENFAKSNQIHPSIIYAFHCYDQAGYDKKVWSRYAKKIPDVKKAFSLLAFDEWDTGKSVKSTALKNNLKVFNI